jgi:hypothetical protein
MLLSDGVKYYDIDKNDYEYIELLFYSSLNFKNEYLMYLVAKSPYEKEFFEGLSQMSINIVRHYLIRIIIELLESIK